MTVANKFARLTLGVALMLGAGAVQAQDAGMTIELNALDPTDDGACQMSFLIENGHPQDITQAVYQAVLFDASGRVDRLTLFDFGNLPSGRPRVRQFVVPGLECEALSRVLFNGSETCEGADADACEAGLTLRSRVETTEVTG